MGILGVILAGGQSRRMGGSNKCFELVGGQSLLAHVCDRLRPQVAQMVISANGPAERYSAFGLPVIPDLPGVVEGPLAGLLAAMESDVAQRLGATHIASVAADTPFLPANLVESLRAASSDSNYTIALATSGGRTHSVIGLWPIALRADLVRWCGETDKPTVLAWADRHPLAKVPFPFERLADGRERDPFFNVNTPDDLALAASLVEASRG
jgi:molybdenum cofactor guanylyltransferase